TQEPKVPPTESLAAHNLPSPSHDLLPTDEDSLELMELMDFCTNLSNNVLESEKKVFSMLDVNDEEHVDVEEVLEVVKVAKLITKVVTTAGVDVNAASVKDTSITATKATKVIVPRKKRGVII
nr:hypothetical protein [Tanacetum cinerariifolium]